MKTPLNFLQDHLLVPLYHFQKKYVSRSALSAVCNKIANFMFENSKETALMMLVFNAVSIISSHIAQIGGLKKSSREHKDYLITQEIQELGLDLIFTIIPPFLINNYLMKKLDSGQWTTKSSREFLLNVITPTVGASKVDLYNTDHIVPVKETLGTMTAKVINSLRKKHAIPKFVNNIFEFIEKSPYVKMPDINKYLPVASMEDVTTDFDIIRKKKFDPFYKGSAYSEINGQRNGLLIFAAIGYTIIASSIITPILKNKLANSSYEKRLNKMGETYESIKRKKRFAYTENTDFNSFTEINTFSSLSRNKTSDSNNLNTNKIFNEFNPYTNTKLTNNRLSI